VTAPRRPFEDVRALLLERARERRNPFDRTDPATSERIVRGLRSTAHDEWVAAFGAAARNCDRDLDAYGYWRVARYPAPTSDPKREAYRRSQEHYLRATANERPPLERVRIPFRGRTGERNAIEAHLRVPPGAGRRSLVMMWGGIDSFKEERRPEPYLAAGLATLGIDMPGVADAPLLGSTDAERMWDPIFDWVGTRADLDPDRVAVMGNSTGGYWAAKLSRTHRDRIRAAVDNGGPVHDAFDAAWIARAQVGEYPFDLAETLAAAFGGSTYDGWLRIAPSLSLVDLGILSRPSAPLLVVHGEDDTVFPVTDARRLIDAGADAHVTPGGHMGSGDTAAAIVHWLSERFKR
jgi:pimeloyl-ACP methyl ester carboxylesterase